MKSKENTNRKNIDFWDELSDDQKKEIQQGINDLKEGKKMEFSEFLKKHSNDQ